MVFYLLYIIANKKEHFSFKGGHAVRVVKHLKQAQLMVLQ